MKCKDVARSGEHKSERLKQLSRILRALLVPLFLCIYINASSQVETHVDTLKTDSSRFQIPKTSTENLNEQYDIGDLATDIFHPNRPAGPPRKKSGITIIPNIASNPTIGSQIGIKAVAGRKLGTDPATYMSVAATSASITTKGIIYFYVNHNIFTNANKWNLQGNLVAAKTVTPDFGLGIGHADGSTEEDKVLTNPARVGRVLQSLFFNFREKLYKEIYKSVFVGAGVSFDIRSKIQQRAVAENALTPYNIYNNKYGFDPGSYMSNGLLFSIQYTSRDNQNRAYKGIYADAGIRMNQTWMGSTKGALQLTSDFRKYLRLSTNHPEHVVAFWNWGSYLISGALPYLELPGTGRDPGSRSGRGYTVGYFKGTKYNYSEVEYRFPITRNKFLSGVTFFHLQTANNDLGTKLFEQWQPGGGGGLRVLFNKATRTNLCLDYAFGRYGRKGFFLGLNEAF
ncbi:hypothetical protein [Segetibacter aerophilus]|uniref:hypothetical protein n=1 Tax=Segetibacter aerophilus TaxID=670293 RepID=UPI001FECB025|nr:hypothetical protein [Segetibacter aerophilus]